jgi:hypothetical protein
MNVKQTFLELLKKYDGDLSKTSHEDTQKIYACFNECEFNNVNPFDVLREVRVELYEIPKTN